MLKNTKRLIALEEKVNHLVDLIESDEVKKLRDDSVELKEIKRLISHVKFKIKDTRIVENTDNGKQSVIVTYELPRIVLELDENGKPSKNDFFYASNMLNMISLEDMSNFQKVLRNRKKL